MNDTTPQPSLEFCEQLFANGVLTAERQQSNHADQLAAVHEQIQRADQLARLDAPGQAPALDLNAAQWALGVLAWSVSLLVDRANADTHLPVELARTEPKGDSACHHWSVDLAFRFLGEVMLRAKAAASEDDLVTELVDVCSRWPLSIVGTQVPWNAERGQIIVDHPSLRRVLLDRIIARSDKHLSQEPSLRQYIEVHGNASGCSFLSPNFLSDRQSDKK